MLKNIKKKKIVNTLTYRYNLVDMKHLKKNKKVFGC